MTHETVPLNRRLYLIFEPADAGKTSMRLSLSPPNVGQAMAALIVRGVLMDGAVVDIDFVSDPKKNPDLTGPTGGNGWTPMFAGEADGTRTLLKVVDWTGGRGIKPALGYVGASYSTALVSKALAFNFNSLKRVDIFTAQTAAITGVASIVFDPPFATVPAKALPTAIPNVLAGPIKAELVAGSLSKTGCQVRVTQQALVGGLVTALAGATVNVIAIEA